MGAACAQCNSYEEELHTKIVVSKQLFVPTQNNPEMFQQIKGLADNQLSQDFGDCNFYRKGLDTYYIGSLEDNTEKSHGVLYRLKETLYYGEFLDGQFNGKGVLKLLNKKIIFRGDFKEGHPFGNGKVYNHSKSFQFQGKWNQNNKPSSGILKFYDNSTIHQIQFIDCESGSVEIIYSNGSFYKGFINMNTLLPHGMGKMNYKSGDSYDGEWANGRFHGTGNYTFRNGQVYNGEYLEGLKNGEGTLHLSEYKYFTGMWKQGKRDGFGKVMQKGGQVVEKGIYRNNKFDQQQSETYLSFYMAKTVKLSLTSQLLESKKRDDEMKDEISIEDKMPKK